MRAAARLTVSNGKDTNNMEKVLFQEFDGGRGVAGMPLCIKEWIKINSNEMGIEQVANRLRRNMLFAQALGKMEKGYFIMWEN